jgi:hypothetical protein
LLLKAQNVGRVHDQMMDLLRVFFAKHEREAHVLINRHRGIEGVVLEDHRDIAVFGGLLRAIVIADHNLPLVMPSRPAIIRRVVDLPHPEGPTKTMNSPSWISILKSSTAQLPPS